jgi:hypothetical protein
MVWADIAVTVFGILESSSSPSPAGAGGDRQTLSPSQAEGFIAPQPSCHLPRLLALARFHGMKEAAELDEQTVTTGPARFDATTTPRPAAASLTPGGAATSASARPHVCSRTWKSRFAEDYARIFGGSGRTGTTASTSCAVAAYRSSMQRAPSVHRRGSGACPNARRPNRPRATTISTHSVSLTPCLYPSVTRSNGRGT